MIIHGCDVEASIQESGLEEMGEFTWLRSKTTSDRRSKSDVTGRINETELVFNKKRKILHPVASSKN